MSSADDRHREASIEGREDMSRTSVETVVCEYIERLQKGENVSSEEVLSRHPELGAEILEQLEVFASLDLGSKVSQPLRTLGDYELLGELGRGGMGLVYEAWQNSLDRRVALKVLPTALAADSRACARFLREAQVAARVHHPNVVGIYGFGVEQDAPYFAMELVEGWTLAELITRARDARRAGPCDTSLAIARELPAPDTDTDSSLACQRRLAAEFARVAEGLQAAHALGIVHRDIKPSNLVVDGRRDSTSKEADVSGSSSRGSDRNRPRSTEGSGRIRILDFGLARVDGQDGLTISGDVLGTPQYMSPEQARACKTPVDHRTDIWSLGATLYETLTLESPFLGRSREDTLSRITSDAPTALRRHVPSLDRDLETIVLKCLEKEPRDRFRSAEALSQELWRFARGDAIETRPPTRLESLARWARRRRTALGLVAALVLILALGASVAAMAWQRELEWRHERYAELVAEALVSLEVANATVPTERLAGDTLFLGHLYGFEQNRAPTTRASIEHAVSLLEEANTLFPGRAEAWLHLSRGLCGLQRIEEAAAALRRSLDTNPDFLPAILRHVRSLRDAGAEEEAEKALRALSAACEGWELDWLDAYRASIEGDYESAERSLTTLLGTRRDIEPFVGFDVEARLVRARLASARGKHQRAAFDLASLADHVPRAPGVRLLLARACYHIGDREEAVAVLEPLLGEHPEWEAVIAAISLHVEHRNHEAAAAVVERLDDEAEREAARTVHLRWKDRAAGLQAAERAWKLGQRHPIFVADYAEILLLSKRPERACELLEEALLSSPGDTALLAQLGRVLYYLSDYDEALERVRTWPPGLQVFEAFYLYRQGRLREALASFDRFERIEPRRPSLWAGRCMSYDALGDEAAWAESIVHLTETDPGFQAGDLRELYAVGGTNAFSTVWDRLGPACRAALPRSTAWTRPRYLAFEALALAFGSQPAPEEALRLAREAASLDDRVEILAYLGEVEAAAGHPRDAIRTLERSTSLPWGLHASAKRLRDLRRGLFPDLVSIDSIDAFLAGEIVPVDSTSVAAARARLGSEESALARYLEARGLEQRGALAAAREALEELATADPRLDVAALVRLARLRARLGEPESAVALLEERCLRDDPPRPLAWAAWMEIAGTDLGLDASGLTQRLARWIGSREPTRPDTRAADSTSAPQAKPSTSPRRPKMDEDVLWLLDRLASDGVVRLSCGGSQDTVDSQGRLWGRDRFACGGSAHSRFRPRLVGPTELDRDTYAETRYFSWGRWSDPALRIPIPPGSYRVSLHVCRNTLGPRTPRFDILVEGEFAARAVAPEFATALRLDHEVRVHDGGLDVELHPHEREHPRHYAMLSALEIRPLDDPSERRPGG